MDLIRLGPTVQVATSTSERLPGVFSPSWTALSLYDLTATARGDVLFHQTRFNSNPFSPPHQFSTLPITAFSANRGEQGTQVTYISRDSIQFDAAEGAAGLLTVRADGDQTPLPGDPQTGRDIFARHFSQDFQTSNSTAITGEIAGEQAGPAIAALRTATATNAMVVWTDTAWPGSADAEVIGRIVDSSGNPVGASFRLTEPATSAGIQERPDVAAMINDRFAVTWISGSEVIRGGTGGDLIVFNAGDNGDLILNFNEGGARDGFDLRGYFDATGFTGANPRAAGVMQVLQNGADTDVYLHGAFAFRIQGVVAAAIDDSYFLFQ